MGLIYTERVAWPSGSHQPWSLTPNLLFKGSGVFLWILLHCCLILYSILRYCKQMSFIFKTELQLLLFTECNRKSYVNNERIWASRSSELESLLWYSLAIEGVGNVLIKELWLGESLVSCLREWVWLETGWHICLWDKLAANCSELVILKDINSINFTGEYSSFYMRKFRKMN